MKKLLFILIFTIFSLFTNISITYAKTCPNGPSDCPSDQVCITDPDNPTAPDKVCRPSSANSVFGKIVPPSPLAGIVAQDQTGAKGLSQFLSNLIALFYSIAGIVLIFMIVWGAFDWLTSEGDKEKVQSAQKKIINAIIGIILFAIAFAVIQVLGHFTGFTFFAGQSP